MTPPTPADGKARVGELPKEIAMMEEKSHRLKVLRVITMMVGGAMMVVGLVADQIGLSTPGSFGKGQILAVSAGLFLLLIGLLGQRVATLYRGAAVLMLNVLVLLVCLELGAHFIFRIHDLLSGSEGARVSAGPQVPDQRAELSYYISQDWSVEYWRAFNQLETHYQPYVVWRRRPFESTTININQDGIRWTPGSNCSAKSYKVFAFGGSTMWGTGSPDWGTIAAYLQAGLEALRDEPVCVVNFGDTAYVSTQSLIELLIQLQSENVPDLVIFYDGVNDVHAAYQSGQAGVHQNLSQIAAKFEGSEAQKRYSLVEWLKASSAFSLLKRIVTRLKVEVPEASPKLTTYQTMGIDTYSLADSVAQTYLSNYKIVEALAQEYGFKYYFFWQPVISIGEKSLTKEEQNMRFRMDPALVSLFDAVYRDIELAALEYENLYYVAHVLDEQDSLIWIDEYHVTPVGNQLIASEMLDVIKNQLAR